MNTEKNTICDDCGGDSRSCGCGGYWRDYKEYVRQQKDKYEARINPIINSLIRHKECKEIGDHWRIGGVWDFWWTGTVRNIKTGENITIQRLARAYKSK